LFTEEYASCSSRTVVDFGLIACFDKLLQGVILQMQQGIVLYGKIPRDDDVTYPDNMTMTYIVMI